MLGEIKPEDFEKLIRVAEEGYKRMAQQSPDKVLFEAVDKKPKQDGYIFKKVMQQNKVEQLRHLRAIKKNVIDSAKIWGMILDYLPRE